MSYKLVDVRIVGESAILQNRFSERAEVEGEMATRRVNVAKKKPRDEAEASCYRNAKGELYFPGAAIMKLLREAGSAHKQKGSRKSVKFLVPSACLVMDESVLLREVKSDKPIKDFEVDSRPVVIPATKGRVMRHRPRIEEWSAKFSLRINENVLPNTIFHQLLREGGEQLGLGDFRPEKGGGFGMFSVVTWAPSEWTKKAVAAFK